jgi:DamX protein
LLTQLSGLNQHQSHQNHRYGLWIGIIMITAAGFAAKTLLPTSALDALLSNHSSNPNTQQTTEAIDDNTLAAATDAETNHLPPTSDFVSAPFLTAALSQNQPAPATETVEANNNTPTELTPSPTLDRQKTGPTAIEQPALEPTETVSPTGETSNTMPESAPTNTATSDDSDWIMAQPVTNYTLQVMTLSSKASASRFIKKHAALKDDLKYYAMGKTGQERYVIIYGSFLSASDAMNRKSTLPNEFNHGLIKRFNVVQKQTRRNAKALYPLNE